MFIQTFPDRKTVRGGEVNAKATSLVDLICAVPADQNGTHINSGIPQLQQL